MRSALLIAAAAALLLAPAAAGAATPLTIGGGENPGLAVDAAGTAYIVWNGTEPGGVRTLRFCRLPRGATACAGAPAIGAPSYTLYRPLVTVSGSTVHVVQTRYGFTSGPFSQVIGLTSNDGGNTWDAGTTIGTITFEEGIAGPGGTFSAVSNATTGGAFFQNLPDTQDEGANLSADHLYNGAVAITPEGRLITVFADASGNAQLRLHSGAGNPNDAATWGPPVELGVESYAKLAGGPSGLYLLGQNAARGLEVRRWTGTTFGPPTVIGVGNEAPQAHISQDAGGVVHVVWPTFEVDGLALHHAVGGPGGFVSSVVTTQANPQEELETRVAAAPDHLGVAVWTTAQEVRAIRLGAEQPVFHKTVVVKPVSGTVRVKLPGAMSFAGLAAASSIPLGATVDARRGRLALSAAPSAKGRPRTVQLYQGRFKVTQRGKVTQFALNEALAACRASASAGRRPKTRRLWGDGSGAFRTSGRYSAATVRGTRWLVQDSCAGTLTRVVKGAVAVRDTVRHKTIILRAGKRYLAKPRR